MRKFWTDAPWADALPALVLIAIWVSLGALPVDEQSIHPLLTALSATSGIALALVTVNLTLLHHPESPYLKRVSEKYEVAYSQTTMWQLVYLISATLLPVVALAFVSEFPAAATGAALMSGALVATVLCRLIWILKLTLGLRARAHRDESQKRAPAPTRKF